jgi:16S rRNA (cytosine967-C5)-methyltransferase
VVKPARYVPEGLSLMTHPGPVRQMKLFVRGEVLVQDEASQIIARLVDPKRNDSVLDLCAGSGVKTTHMAALMENEGRILAVDVNEAKLRDLRECAGRLGAGIIETCVHDAGGDLGADFHGAFDRILVDVPCSGLGTLRRNPEIRWRLAPGDINAMAVLQTSILEAASRYLKKGGIMVYSTCTISARENEDVVREFTGRNRAFRLVTPPALIDTVLVDGEGYFRSVPHRHGMDGFFGAVLRKERE